MCESLGIKLIQIYGDEWDHKKDIIKSIINNKLGLIEDRIFARKCNIIEVDVDAEREFFNKNHISGYVKSIKCYGLEYNGELVLALSIRKPFTKKRKGSIEIARFSSKLNTVVVGGFSKLLIID